MNASEIGSRYLTFIPGMSTRGISILGSDHGRVPVEDNLRNAAAIPTISPSSLHAFASPSRQQSNCTISLCISSDIENES